MSLSIYYCAKENQDKWAGPTPFHPEDSLAYKMYVCPKKGPLSIAFSNSVAKIKKAVSSIFHEIISNQAVQQKTWNRRTFMY